MGNPPNLGGVRFTEAQPVARLVMLAVALLAVPAVPLQSMMLNPRTAPSDNIGRLATAARQDLSPAISQGAGAVNSVSRSVSRIAYLACIVGGAWVVCVGVGTWMVCATMDALFLTPGLNQRKLANSVYADHDHDMLRAFFYTTAKDDKLLKLVLKKTKGDDLSDPHYNQVRAAIEHCRRASELGRLYGWRHGSIWIV